MYVRDERSHVRGEMIRRVLAASVVIVRKAGGETEVGSVKRMAGELTLRQRLRRALGGVSPDKVLQGIPIV